MTRRQRFWRWLTHRPNYADAGGGVEYSTGDGGGGGGNGGG
jgi:hypothetical protein